jgi:hypothetical protein
MRNAPVCCPRYLLRKHISSACWECLLGVPVGSACLEVTLRLRNVVIDSEFYLSYWLITSKCQRYNLLKRFSNNNLEPGSSSSDNSELSPSNWIKIHRRSTNVVMDTDDKIQMIRRQKQLYRSNKSVRSVTRHCAFKRRIYI